MFEWLYDYSIAVCTSLVLVCILGFTIRRGKHKNLPPGRNGLSPLGDALLLRKYGMLEVCRQYRQAYGDVFTLRIFNSTIVVCSGYETLKELCVRNKSLFIDRAKRPLPDFIWRSEGIITANGEIWKHNRRFSLQTLRDFGLGKSRIELKIHEEIEHLFHEIDKTNGAAFNIRDLLTKVSCNIIISIVFGHRFDYQDEDYTTYLHNLDKSARFSDFYKKPWHQFIPGDPTGVKDYFSTLMSMRQFCEKRIDAHFKDFNPSDINDLVDVYIKKMKEDNDDTEDQFFNKKRLTALVHDLLSAGTHTTAVTLQWALVFIMRDEAVQATIQKELDSCVPNSRYPTTSDRTKLVYTNAAVHEVLRRATTIPFTGRTAHKDTECMGYMFPKGMVILVNIESTLMDSKLWDDPLSFNPSRFLDDKAKEKLDKLLTFGLGPRVCLGESLARMEVFLIFAAMLQRYKILPPKGEGPPGVEGNYGKVHEPKPFKIRAIRRDLSD